MQRSNFFGDQNVVAGDFNYIESSKIDAIRALAVAISPPSGSYTTGVVGTYLLSPGSLYTDSGSSTSVITVLSGTALDNNGDQIFVPVDTGSYTPGKPEREDLSWAGNGAMYVKIAYAEMSGSYKYDDLGAQYPTRYYDSYEITIDTDAPTANEVLLATFTSVGGAISGDITDQRRWLGSLTASGEYLPLAGGVLTGTLTATDIIADSLSIDSAAENPLTIVVHKDIGTPNNLFNALSLTAEAQGTVEAGWGTGITYVLETATGDSNLLAGAFKTSWLDPALATATSQMMWSTYINGASADGMALSNGELRLYYSGSSNYAPGIVFRREGAEEGSDDSVGALIFKGNVAGGDVATYGRTRCDIYDATSGSHEGSFIWTLSEGGELLDSMRLDPDGVLHVRTGGDGTPAQVDTFDEYDDPVLVEDLVKGRDIDNLERLGLVKRWGNMTTWAIQPTLKLLGGGVYQLRDRVAGMEARLAALET